MDDSEPAYDPAWPPGHGEMARRVRERDWAATLLGPVETWPHALRDAVDLMLPVGFPMVVLWGPQLTQIYNDGYRTLMGNKHPAGLGQTTRECWPEVWDINAPIYARALAGETLTFEDALYPITRSGRLEDAWFTLTYSPLRDGESIAGVLVTVFETTGEVRHQRALRENEERQTFLLQLSDTLRPLTDGGEIERQATRLLGEYLQADRCFLSPVYEDGLGMCVREEYLRAGASSVLGDYTFAQFGDFVGPELHADHILAVEDVGALTGLSAAERASYAATQIGAYLLIPLVRNGRLAAFLTINHRTPRAWSDADKAVARQTADRLWIARERARAEAALRESEERQTFLLKLSDVLQPLADPAEIMETTSALLGSHLHVGRCGYGEVDATGAFLVVARDWTDGVIDSLAGTLRLDDFGDAFISAYRAGRTVVLDDVYADPRARGVEEAFEAIGGLRASLAVPLVKNGDWVAVFYVQQSTARHWTHDDETLVREVAERTWAAVGRARAEAALRESEALREVALSAGRMGTWKWDLARRLVWGDAQFMALYGLPPTDDEVALEVFTERMSSASAAEMEVIVTRAIEAGDEFAGPIEIVSGRSAGTWVRWQGRAAADDPTMLHGVTFDITEQHQTEAALRVSERRLQRVLETDAVAVLFFTTEGVLVGANDVFLRMTGYSRAEVEAGTMTWRDMTPPEYVAESQAQMDQFLETGRIGPYEKEYLRKDGSRSWLLFAGRDLGDGTIVEFGVDIADRKRAMEALRDSEDRLQVLVAELQHRVRNILTVVRSVFARTFEVGGDAEGLADHFRGRLDALARTQVMITRTVTGTADLENMIRDELLAVGVSDGPRVTIEGPDVALPGKTVESIGLAIHELTTNALKYGALKAPGASLTITWTINIGYKGSRRLVLTWREQGVPALTVRPARKGFGSELITEALPYRLGAETKLEFLGGGVRCTIDVPLPESDGVADVA